MEFGRPTTARRVAGRKVLFVRRTLNAPFRLIEEERSRINMRGSCLYLFVLRLLWGLVVCVAVAAFGDAQTSPNNADGSWTTRSENLTDQSNPYRTIESHIKSGNRTLDNKTVEVRGPDGQFELYFRIETETIQESPTVVRSITRAYNPDGDRNDALDPNH